MQRTIKFRGKRVDNGEWVYGFGIVMDWFRNIYFIAKVGDPIVEHIDMVEVIEETVGQFTGLKDKNGKEIYEGDICKVLYSSIGFQIDVMGVVYWGDWSMSYQIYLLPNQDEYKLADYKSDIEVIGNIHDNHELLK